MTLTDSFKEKIKDGLTIAEISQLFTELIQDAMQKVADLTISGPEKKQRVLDSVSELFDLVAPQILPTYLTVLRSFLRPYIKRLVLLISEGVIEGIYISIYKKETL